MLVANRPSRGGTRAVESSITHRTRNYFSPLSKARPPTGGPRLRVYGSWPRLQPERTLCHPGRESAGFARACSAAACRPRGLAVLLSEAIGRPAESRPSIKPSLRVGRRHVRLLKFHGHGGTPPQPDWLTAAADLHKARRRDRAWPRRRNVYSGRPGAHGDWDAGDLIGIPDIASRVCPFPPTATTSRKRRDPDGP